MFIRNRYEDVFSSIQRTLTCTNNSRPNECRSKESDQKKNELDEITEFNKILTQNILNQISFDKRLNQVIGRIDTKIDMICCYLLKAILAKAYGVGRCDEFAALGLICLLKKGFANNISLIGIKGALKWNKEKNGHIFLLLDQSPESDFNNPSTLEAIRFDAWGDEKIEIYKKDRSRTHEALGGSSCQDIQNEIVQVLYLDKNLSAVECKQIIRFLKVINIMFDPLLLEFSGMMSGRTAINHQKELSDIYKIINEEIVDFQALKKSPPLSAAEEFLRVCKSQLTSTASASVVAQLLKRSSEYSRVRFFASIELTDMTNSNSLSTVENQSSNNLRKST